MGYSQAGKAMDSDSIIPQVRVLLSQPEKPTSFDLSVFQLNSPLRVGEILLRNVKIRLQRVKFASTASGWI